MLLWRTWAAAAASCSQRRAGALLTSGSRFMSAGSPTSVSVSEDVVGDGGKTVPYANTASSGNFVLRGDLAPQAGGTNVGPSPKEYAMTAVGMCVSITVRMYAQRKQWPLERVAVDVKEHTKEGAHVPDSLEMTLKLYGDLTEQQRKRLLEISGNCPVKKMMMGGMPNGIAMRLLS
eukprot:jgi/Chlat1/7895/Chrsp66S07200